MDLDKVFNALESNQNQESEEAKKRLVELFTQSKEQYLVQYMMEYYLKTASVRIVEVLVKVQAPHDGYIFDRLAEWLKISSHRNQALNLFCFVVRKHPTWLFKVEKHRLIKDMLHWLKQLEIEKEIVPLMSALLAIITLLPIIPNLVPNFLNDLFGVFAHLATWNNQNPNRLTEDKLVHLQLGLQMLFHRLYGMFPCNFMSFLTEFTRREKGAIFQHTIKPLLETVRLHPMLITATAESEINSERWKEIQPHDVVVECMRLSLPYRYHDITSNVTDTAADANDHATTTTTTSSSKNAILAPTNVHHQSVTQHCEYRESYQTRLSSDSGNSFAMWSPYHEIISTSHIPLTPTQAPYIMPASSKVGNRTNLEVSGCSPPEAAVEATPETTPLKDNGELKRISMANTMAINNPLAVRAIFASSQPSSPLKTKDTAHHQQQQQHCYTHFTFPDVGASNAFNDAATTYVEQEFNTKVITRITTTDRRVKQMLQDRKHSQSPFQTIEAQAIKMGFTTPPEACLTPEVDPISSTSRYYQPPYNLLSNLSATPTPTPTSTPLPMHQKSVETPLVTKVCDDCNETEQSMCTEGGLQIPTSRSVQLLAKGMKRRNRMTSYCYNERSCEKVGMNGNSDEGNKCTKKVRRTKSCSSLLLNSNQAKPNICASDGDDSDKYTNFRPLQKSNRMVAIPSAFKIISSDTLSRKEDVIKKAPVTDKCVQTVESVPALSHEFSLLQMLLENKECRSTLETSYRRTPNEVLEQFIAHGLRNNSALERYDQEQFQLLCLQLQYERYRREIHAERNRRLMGRSRDKRSLEMERDRLREQLKDFEIKNRELCLQLDRTIKVSNERERQYQKEVESLKVSYHNEMDTSRGLRQAKELLETQLKSDADQLKDVHYELEALRSQVFSLTTELQHAQQRVELGVQCKQELTRLEADSILMGEMLLKCREQLMDMDNFKPREEELQILQDAYNLELKDLKHNFDEKISQLDSARHKLQELQTQLLNSEKVITEQKRLLKAVKDEYEEKFKALNKKYEVQKTIIMQLEEKFMMSQQKPTPLYNTNTCYSPDTDKTDIGSSVERNSPLSTSLASSESLSTSLRSSELRNLQQLVEPSVIPEVNSATAISSNLGVLGISAAVNITDGQKLPSLDLASSANTVANIIHTTAHDTNKLNSPDGSVSAISRSGGLLMENSAVGIAAAASAGSSGVMHMHPHLHLRKQQQQQFE